MTLKRRRNAYFGLTIACAITCGCQSPSAHRAPSDGRRAIASVESVSTVSMSTANRGDRESDSSFRESSKDTTNAHSDRRSSIILASARAINPPDLIQIASANFDSPIQDSPTPESNNPGSLESRSDVQTIDLSTALMLTTGQNPQVQFARARIEEANAQLERSYALKLPSIRAGLNYNKHEGRIQDVVGDVIETSRGSFYHGFGANAVGAGSPAVPGLLSHYHIADAIFQPRIAERTYCARRNESRAVVNDSLLATALAYIDLLRTQQELAVAREIYELAQKLEKTTAEFARVGSGLASDHDRARAELALREVELLRAEETTLVSSSRLAQLIRWDASQQLVPSESQLVPVSMVDSQISRQELVAMALSNRPELAEAKHLVGAAVERLQRERNAPLVPSVILGASYGGLAGGTGSSLSNYGDRIDLDAGAYWEVRQLGIGERASRREAQSRISQARALEMRQLDKIAQEVVEAQIQSESRFRQIEVAEKAIQAANQSYDRNHERIRNGQGLAIELLQAIHALSGARRDYVRSVADYNVAQFTLHRSLGWPIESSSLNSASGTHENASLTTKR
ncbi:MAG: TolC family protein [Pirellula sp.]